MAKEKNTEKKKRAEEESLPQGNAEDSSEQAQAPGDESWEAKYREADAMCLRALADYRNLLSQSAKERADFVKYANEGLLLDLLPVYENLKAALLYGDDGKGSAWFEGVKHVAKQFKEVLIAAGIEEIESLGKPFDHSCMDAIEGQGEKVIREITSGYRLNGKVIQAAKVVVG